jgi:dihydroorotase
MPSLLIRDGILVDPAAGLERPGHLLVRDGRIEAIDPRGAAADETLDAAGAFVLPGFVDMHVHLREPGFEHKETIATGLAAAVRGGFTAVAPMPNTQPVCDSPKVLKHVLERAAAAGLARVHPIAAITTGSRGPELADLAQLAALGCRAFSNDGQPVEEAETMRRAMQAVRRLGGVVIDHCEDKSLARGGAMHAGPEAEGWGVSGQSPLAEEVHVARDVLLAEETGCRLHVAHLSTARGLELVRWARRRGAPVTAEAAPHHFCLSIADMPGPNPNFKMNPPLRPPADRDALLEGLAAGDIDAIATDHAPHTEAEKARGFEAAPFGVIGLETAVPLVMERLYHTGRMSIARIALACAVRPAEILGAPARSLQPGAAANLTLVDPGRAVTIDRAAFASRSRNTPFEGWRLRGAVRATVVDGRVVYIN